MSNDFIKLMRDPEYKQREREARDDTERKHRERVERNTAPDREAEVEPDRGSI